MRRINLLPRDERRFRPLSGLGGAREIPVPGGAIGVLAISGGALVVLMAGVYLLYAVRIGNVEQDISSLDGKIADRQARVAELQPFGDLQASLDAKKPVADGIYRTRFSWDGFLKGLAYVTPDTTSLDSFDAQASPVDVTAQSGETLSPAGSITFSGVALADYRNVADFVVQMNALSYLRNSELNSAELDRDTYKEPAINFEVSASLVTQAGENGDEVPLDGTQQSSQNANNSNNSSNANGGSG